MYALDKCILVTNNDRAKKLGKGMQACILLDSYEEVLLKTRDLIHRGYALLTHPQASSLKPNQTPFRSVLLYGERGSMRMEELSLIENALDAFYKWNRGRKVPRYDERIENDYKTVDLSMLQNVLFRL